MGQQGRKGMETKEGEERRGRVEELQWMGETGKQEWNGGSMAGEKGRKEGRRREEEKEGQMKAVEGE